MRKLKPAFGSPDGKPHVQRSIVAFFDILGFSEELRRAEAENRMDEYLQKIDSVLRVTYEVSRDSTSDDYRERLSWEVKTFTDNIALGHPIGSSDEDVSGHTSEGDYGFVMGHVALLQLGLALEGFFVRGGIAVGDLYMDDELVFGVGLLDAVEAEKSADTPRVVLNMAASELVQGHMKRYSSPETAPQSRSLLRDEDNQLFLNYLGEAQQTLGEPPDYGALEKHRDIVTERLAFYRATPRIWAKYSWVARYHNYVCTDFFPDVEDYQIDLSVLSLQPGSVYEP